MDVLHIALIVLVAVGIWAVVELALTIRKARSSVEQITRTANETIEQAQPIIAKADGMVDELQPAVKGVQPLIDKAGTAVDVATVDLATLSDILNDVSDVSGAASNVTNTVSRVADSAVNGVVDAVGKLSGRSGHRKPAIAGHAQRPQVPSAREDEARGATPAQPEGAKSASAAHAGVETAAKETASSQAPRHAAKAPEEDSYVTYDSTNSDMVDGE